MLFHSRAKWVLVGISRGAIEVLFRLLFDLKFDFDADNKRGAEDATTVERTMEQRCAHGR